MDIEAIEESWMGRVQPAPGCFGWEPAPLAVFTDLLGKLPVPCSLLEVGCGPGTKMLLAQDAGLTVTGIEISPELASAARDYDLDVRLADAREYSYGGWDCVYVNHPLLDQGFEEVLEQRIHTEMDSGAYLMVINAGCWPERWERLGGRKEDWTGVFRKPWLGR